jgi:PAS domain S-box-containing protein
LEDSLRKSEERLRLALNSGTIGVWDWDMSSGQFTVSPELGQIYGVDLTKLRSYGDFAVHVHPDDLATVESERDVAIRNHEPFDTEFRILLPSGDIRWIAARGQAYYDGNGRVVRVVGNNIDITDRVQTKEALRISEQKLRLGLVAGRLGTWQYDFNTGVFDGNDAVGKKIHGFDPREVIETLEQAMRYVHPDDAPRIRHEMEQEIADGASHNHEYRVVLPSGETRWIASVWMRQSGTSVIFGVVQDITERKRVELDLRDRNREQEHTLRLLLETAAQGILSVDAAGLIVMANAATEKMFGWKRGELIGQPVELLVPVSLQDRHATTRAAYFRGPQARLRSGMEFSGQRKDGSMFPIEVSLNHVATTDGGHAIAFVTDISERKRDHEALQRSHAELQQRTLQLRRLASQLTLAEQQAREQIARTLHDGLQQQLFTAALALDRAAQGGAQAGQRDLFQKARTEISEATEAARTLSVNLFPPILHVGGLPVALSWLAKRTQEQYGVVVSVTAEPQANPTARDTRILLFEAVRELLFNAVKHARVDRVDVNLAVGSDETIRIQVSDDGVGFDPSATVHDKDQQQTGLGLFSIQERLALLGGHLDILSAPGKGSRFTLILPLTDLAGTPSPFHDTGVQGKLVPDLTSRRSKPLRILIADDHAVVRAGLRELLSERPELQIVGEAANGIEAIAQARTLQPDVIVLDVSMPEMNGIEATREIHRTLPHIQIVGLSTYSDETTEHSMREAGARAHFSKTESSHRLIEYLLSLRPKAARVFRKY